jgi:acetyl-CoA carboxylase alpha subunit
MAKRLKEELIAQLNELNNLPIEQLLKQRYTRIMNYGIEINS